MSVLLTIILLFSTTICHAVSKVHPSQINWPVSSATNIAEVTNFKNDKLERIDNLHINGDITYEEYCNMVTSIITQYNEIRSILHNDYISVKNNIMKLLQSLS